MKVNYKGKDINLPDFLIVGAAKSGTTSLFYYLSNHSSIFAPDEKEPHFFTFYNNPANFTSPSKMRSYSSIEEYTSLFDGISSDQITGEGSTSYLYDYDTAITNIKSIYGKKIKDLKIIILLRNPVKRAWSQYWQFRKFYFEPLSFEESITPKIIKERLDKGWSYFYDYTGFGNYHNQVKAYLDNFKHVKIYLQEELLSNSDKIVEDTLDFLDLPQLEVKLDTERKFNPSGKPKNNFYGKVWSLKNKTSAFKFLKSVVPLKYRKKITYFFMENAMERQKMPEGLKQQLARTYDSEIEKLYDLIGNENILKWRTKK
ncbi:sulfotransferase domain-containing protein [uncultured Olleya sp.]|uniref:sulfotransferase domain-containing protein n=1 Tax=uncultured Olleya sp. TaxID=757243 RepID=UPI0025960357|nr:sulfotransferase domain-containing protein [uncultured Olleya sp.]